MELLPPAHEPVIRPERPTDIDQIRAVHEAAFPTPAEAQLVAALRTAGRLVVSLVAELDGEFVGHVAFRPLEVLGGVGLAPVAVVPQRQSCGLGSALIREGLDRCRAAGWRFVVVLGAPRYYSRFGFQAASRWGLIDEYAGGEAFQVLALVPDGIPSNAGLVRFAREFAKFAV